MTNDQKRAEAQLAREFAARLEARSEAADAEGRHDDADRLHRKARLHRADARALEAELAS